MPTPRETVVAFLTQACCGTIVALHRMGGMEVMLYKEQLVVMLTRYFNSCWNSLLSGDDPYVVESFNMMKHDNPGCVMRYLFSVGTSVLPDEPPQEIARYSPEDTDDLEAARVTISETLQQLLAERIAVDPFQHSCEGLSLSAERTAWSEKGCGVGDHRMRASFGSITVAELIAAGKGAHEVQSPPGDTISSIRFSPAGCPLLLVGATSWDKSCRVWQVDNSSRSAAISSKPLSLAESGAPILDMSFSEDGRVFFGGCDKSATMWNLTTGQKTVVASHDLPISCLSYVLSPTGGDMLITGSWDGKLRYWDMKQPRPVKEDLLGEPIFALDAQRSFPMAACVTGRKVHVFNMQFMSKVMELDPPKMMKFSLRCVACSPQHDGVAVGSSEGRVSFIPLRQESGCTFKAHVVEENNVFYMHQTNFCSIDSKTGRMITGGGDGRIAVWDYKKRCNVCYENDPKLPNRNNSISAGDISADCSLLAYARSYDWAMGKTRAITNEPHTIHIRSANPTQLKAR